MLPLWSDPHPGNLIRTPEGKLAILDFGLMTQITDNQKFGMIEAISHLVHRDYEGIGDDFKRLDFIPEEVRGVRLCVHLVLPLWLLAWWRSVLMVHLAPTTREFIHTSECTVGERCLRECSYECCALIR